MDKIRKTTLTDDDKRPVAVQIDYSDWLEIERRLGLESGEGRSQDLGPFANTIVLKEDPLEYQRRLRSEWR